MRQWPLRLRVALGYGLGGLALSLVFAASIGYLVESYESLFSSTMLNDQAEKYLGALAADPDTTLPHSPALKVYRVERAPPEFQRLAPGIHEIEPPDLPELEELHVGVFEGQGQRVIVVLDMGYVEVLEQYVFDAMFAVVFGGTALSALLGWLLAERAIRPVERLARAVEALPLRPTRTELAAGLARDGIGRLAAAVDAYQARLSDADAKEREFFADASHELRTPLTVIQGAVEVLQDDPDALPTHAAKLSRIERSSVELELLLEALLLSARGLPAEFDALDFREVCEVALARIVSRDPSAASRLRLVPGRHLTLQAPRRWAACIVDVLLFKLLATAGTAWEVTIIDTRVSFAQPRPGSGTGAGVEMRRSDLGLGFVFVERLCRALGWQLRQYIAEDAGLSLELETGGPG